MCSVALVIVTRNNRDQRFMTSPEIAAHISTAIVIGALIRTWTLHCFCRFHK